ncbi:hypothetical protein B4U79_19133, partial [Dinothrombium tinctorium]
RSEYAVRTVPLALNGRTRGAVQAFVIVFRIGEEDIADHTV